MALPPRKKLVRPDEWHLFCAGAGCDTRLAIERHLRGPDLNVSVIELTLEPVYTQEPNPLYPEGSWWRKKGNRYRGTPRAKDIRRRLRQLPDATTRYINLALAFSGFTGKRRVMRVGLPKGDHVVICYDCTGAALIEVP